MLNDRLACSKRTWNGSRPALGDWEKGINHSLARHQRLLWNQLLSKWATSANRPLLHKTADKDGAVCLFNLIGRLIDSIAPRFYLSHTTADTNWYQNTMHYQLGFLNCA